MGRALRVCTKGSLLLSRALPVSTKGSLLLSRALPVSTKGSLLLSKSPIPVLAPTRPPLKWIMGFLSARIKRPQREADNDPPSGADVKSEWSYTSTPPICLHEVDTDSFTFTSLMLGYTFSFVSCHFCLWTALHTEHCLVCLPHLPN
jgi:hypothetical protein